MPRIPLRMAGAVVAAAVLVVVGLTAWRPAAHAQPDAAPPPAPTVDVATIIHGPVVEWQTYSGRLEAVDQVELRPLVSGTLTAVNVREGGRVKKGDALFTIDPRPYAVAVERARAQLAAASARADYTAGELARNQRLIAENAVARRDLDERQNAAREAAANLQAARAALDAAQLDLSHTRVTAPVDGRVSRADLTVGNIVNAGASQPPLATLVSVASLYAAFDVDERSYLKYLASARDAGGAQVFMGLATEEAWPRQGRVRSIANRLDTASGTVRVHAVFDNPDGLLVPGLYARIRLGGGAPRDALLVDERAVGTDQDKRFVLVVDGANKTAYREVRLGANVDGLRVVETGLAVGERIVVSGLQRVRPGDTVSPRAVQMAASGPSGVALAAAR